MKHRSLLAAVVSSTFIAAAASADVPPPPAVCPPPATGASPGTNGLPPIPPPPGANPGSLTPPALPPSQNPLPPVLSPADRPSNPNNPDPTVNNTVPAAWLTSMQSELYYSWTAFQAVETYAYDQYQKTGLVEAWNLYVQAAELRIYFDQYYWAAYNQSGPLVFAWGNASRGDFNFGYNWWIRPVYLNFIDAMTNYHHKLVQRSDIATYLNQTKPALVEYHRFTRCNFGHQGKDPSAPDDPQAYLLEEQAGVSLTLTDILGS